MRFWNRNKPKHDCKEHCGHAVDEQIRPKEHEKLDEHYQMQSDFVGIDIETKPNFVIYDDLSKLLVNINYKDLVGLVLFFKEILKIKKYQLLAKKYNLEFEFGEDV